MKKQINSVFALVLTAIVLAGSQFAASAQTPCHLAFEAPFAFVAGERELPAGRYRIRRVKPDSEAALRVEDERGRVLATVLTNAADAPSQRAALTFIQYGGRHFLAGVWMPGAAGGRELQESAQQRLAREQATANHAEPATVALAARK